MCVVSLDLLFCGSDLLRVAQAERKHVCLSNKKKQKADTQRENEIGLLHDVRLAHADCKVDVLVEVGVDPREVVLEVRPEGVQKRAGM